MSARANSEAIMTTDAFGSLMEIPVVGAPLAGGSSTPELTAAVSLAGGLGFIAAGYKTVDEVRREIEQVQTKTRRPFGVNVFFPTQLAADETAVSGYAARLDGGGRALRRDGLGQHTGATTDRTESSSWSIRERPAVASFTFGCPDRTIVAQLHGRGTAVWCTVTSPTEAKVAAAAGVDALVVQGAEAGGHQGSFDDTDEAPIGLLVLLQLVRDATHLPLVAAGGIANGKGVAGVIAAGASAAQIGSGLMLTPEAGTSAPHRAAFAGDAPTALTRAFSGRRARGIRQPVYARSRRRGAEGVPAGPLPHRAASRSRACRRRRRWNQPVGRAGLLRAGRGDASCGARRTLGLGGATTPLNVFPRAGPGCGPLRRGRKSQVIGRTRAHA